MSRVGKFSVMAAAALLGAAALVPMEQAEAQQDPGQSPERAVEGGERLARTMAGIATRLSPMERRVLALFLDGQPYSAIAKRLGVQEKTVDNALQRVKRKVGTHLAARAVPA